MEEKPTYFISVANYGYPLRYGLGPSDGELRALSDTSMAPEVKSKLRSLLDKIIKNQKIPDSKELSYFTQIVEQAAPIFEVKNGRLYKTIKETRNREEFLSYPYWLRVLSVEIVEYLLDSKNDLRKIKKCKLCKNFFSSIKVDKRTKYCPLCSPKNKMSKEQRKIYQRRRRAAKKSEKDNFTKNEYITRLIKEGCSREEAEKTFEETIKPDL